MSSPLALPVYSIGDWSGNVVDDHGVGWVVNSEDGWSSTAQVRGRVEPREDAHGGIGRASLFGPRTVTLSGTADGPSRAAVDAAKERLLHALPMRTAVPLTVEGLTRTQWTLVRTASDPMIRDRGPVAFDWQITVTSTDYRKYGDLPETGTVPLAGTVRQRRAYPKVYPYTYAIASSDPDPGTVTITNEGLEPTPAIITVKGPVTALWSLHHLGSGRVIPAELALAGPTETTPADYAIIDTGRGTLIVNDATPRPDVLRRPQWWQLQPGLNRVQWIATPSQATAPEDAPSVTVAAYPAWR